MGKLGKSILGGVKNFAKWNLNYKTGGLFDRDSFSVPVRSPVKILGEIYKMMKIMEEDKRLNHEMANSHLESEELKKEQRNKEIIKALTGRKVKKPKIKRERDEKGRFKKADEPPHHNTKYWYNTNYWHQKLVQHRIDQAVQKAEEKAIQKAEEKAEETVKDKTTETVKDNVTQKAKEEAEKRPLKKLEDWLPEETKENL
jgi:hypothetical protein